MSWSTTSSMHSNSVRCCAQQLSLNGAPAATQCVGARDITRGQKCVLSCSAIALRVCALSRYLQVLVVPMLSIVCSLCIYKCSCVAATSSMCHPCNSLTIARRQQLCSCDLFLDQLQAFDVQLVVILPRMPASAARSLHALAIAVLSGTPPQVPPQAYCCAACSFICQMSGTSTLT